jgi:CBS domain containing-hemolysin-like protein
MGGLLALKLAGLFVLLGCSALLTGAEAAYFSLGRARLRQLTDSDSSDRRLTPLIERPHEMLVTLLVGITFVNIGASAVAAEIAAHFFGQRGVVVSIGAMVFLLTVFGEVLPMRIAVQHPAEFAAAVKLPVAWLSWFLAPVRSVLSGLTTMTVRSLGRPRVGDPELSAEELRTLVDVGVREGIVERGEREMIHKVFELEDTLARTVMVPRTDIFCLDVKTPVREILPALRDQLHSRVPVYEGTIDSIVGILYTKDLLRYLHGLPDDFDLRSSLRPPFFVPESKRADELLKEFQAKKLHLAIVVDEYGGTAGLVSLEDLLEELVGEIADEHDEPERLIQVVNGTTYRVAGKLPIDELNAATGLAISDEAYDTVGGWVLVLFGRVPRRGERVETPEVAVSVEKVERNRIVEVLISLRTPSSDEAAA